MVAGRIGGSNVKFGTFMRARIWLGILIGSSIGGIIPELWGAGLFSYSSVLLSSIGAFVGLWIGYKTG
jgi:predicted MFS family arabinose efflux permease